MNKITKIPDGSGFFTTTIMSRKEAMALPPNKRPICFRISSQMYHSTFEHIAAAAMSSKSKGGRFKFDSNKASQIAVELCFKIAEEMEGNDPNPQHPPDRAHGPIAG